MTARTPDLYNGQHARQCECRYQEYCGEDETGLYYLNTRYYDPEAGRFINADDSSVLQAGQEHLMEHNLYSYCLNSPVNLKDEDGEFPKWASNLIKIGIGAAATVATTGTASVAIPAIVSSLKIAGVSAAIGGTIEAGGSAIKQRISSGSGKGAGKAALKGFADGFSDGFMWGGIAAGATFTTAAAKGAKIKQIGRLKPSNKKMLI